jgi:hypothetical protein
MKCIHCGKNPWRGPRDGRCPACQHRFAFDPDRDPHGMTDEEFHDALQFVTGYRRHTFSDRQLWHALGRPRIKPSRVPELLSNVGLVLGIGGTMALGVLDVVELPLVVLFLVGVVPGIILSMLASALIGPPVPVFHKQPRIPWDEFPTYLARWSAAHGRPLRLLDASAASAALPAVPADVAAFSFDRAVVVQHAEVAALLVDNRFHFEHRCAVLSLDGYPFGIAQTVKEMLRRNPQLTVFALHDASAEGVALPFTLRGPAWFPDPETLIVDVGIRTGSPVTHGPPVKLPAHIAKQMGKDLAWLEAGNRAELAALSPGDILGKLERAITAAGLPGQPARVEAARLAAAGGGVVLADSIPLPAADTAASDGFG